jgi:hypothetical protein
MDRKRRTKHTAAATAAAVAVALAMKAEENAIRAYPLPPRVVVSAWQAVLRSNTHSTRGKVR